jgi:hypothetical protein
MVKAKGKGKGIGKGKGKDKCTIVLVRAVKVYRVEQKYRYTLNLGTKQKLAATFTAWPLYKKLQYPMNRKLDRPKGRSGHF